MIGRTGRVTGRIAAGTTGEVHIEIRGGTEAFLAFPAHIADVFEVGTKVQVADYLAPNKVYVEALSAE